jgi:hemerythrin-like domain-containing protein
MKHTSLQIIRDEHASLAAMLQSMRMMVDRGPADNAENFFDVMRAMLFYIDEFPERLHHPKESNLLFPRVAKAVPHVMGTVDRLERDHMHSEKSVRDVQHLLLSWELLGDSRRQAFTDAFKQYVDAYLEHMRLEEEVILPEAEKVLTEADWKNWTPRSRPTAQRRVVGVALFAAAVEGGAVGLVERAAARRRAPGPGWR